MTNNIYNFLSISISIGVEQSFWTWQNKAAVWNWAIHANPSDMEEIIEKKPISLFSILANYLDSEKYNPQDAFKITSNIMGGLLSFSKNNSGYIGIDIYKQFYDIFFINLVANHHFDIRINSDKNWQAIIEFLICNHANLYASDLLKCCSCMSPRIFHYAIIQGDKFLIDEALTLFSPASYKTFPNGDSPVHVAIQSLCPNTLTHLLSKGFDPNQLDKLGDTPAGYLMIMDIDEDIKLKLLKVLELGGANLNRMNSNQDTLLHLAISQHTQSVANFAIKAKVLINQYNNVSETALINLVKYTQNLNLEHAKLLIENGADPMLEDMGDKNSFLHIFTSRKYEEDKHLPIKASIFKLFLKHGYRPHSASKLPSLQLLNRSKTSEFEQECQILLTTGGFNADPGDTSLKSDFIGDIQGCKEMRRIVCHLPPSIFNPNTLIHHRLINPKLYVALIVKRFAHALGLKNNTLNSRYEGFSEAFSKSMLASSLESSIPLPGLFSKEDFDWVNNKVSHAYIADRMDDNKYKELSHTVQNLDYSEALVMGCGFDWHYFDSILFGNFIIFVNKGDDSVVGEEIRIFFIPDKSKMTPEYLKQQIDRYASVKENYQSQIKMIAQLGLIKIVHFRLKSQSTGNCTYSNSKGGIYVLMAIRSMINSGHPLNEHILRSGKIWELAFSTQQVTYKYYTEHDRQEAVKSVLMGVDHILEGSHGVEEHDKEEYFNLLYSSIFAFKSVVGNEHLQIVKRLHVIYRSAILERAAQLGSIMRVEI